MMQEQIIAKLLEAKQNKLDSITTEKEKQIMKKMKEEAVDVLEKATAEQGADGSTRVDGVEASDNISEKISKILDTPAADEQKELESDEPEELESDEPEENESVPVLSNSNLPMINPSDQKAALCVRDNFALVMMPIYCQESKLMEGCKFYLEDIVTGIPQIGASNEIRMEKDKIMGADNHSVMSSVNRFIINFSDDDLKLAFERAKIFLENAKNMVGVSSSMNIIDAYREVIKFALEKAAQEEAAKVMDVDRKCKYIKKEDIVAISDKYFKELIEEIGIGYTPVVFCKKLTMVEAHYNQKLMLHNGGRYARNTGSNKRFYNFYIVTELMGNGGAA